MDLSEHKSVHVHFIRIHVVNWEIPILSERVIDPFYQKIRTCAQDVLAQDQARFIEIVEKEVRGVHEGNVGRYRVSRLEYAKWLKGWH